MQKQNIKYEGFGGIPLKNEGPTLKINFAMLNQESVTFCLLPGNVFGTHLQSKRKLTKCCVDLCKTKFVLTLIPPGVAI
jgi:hypothetical protein